VIAWLPLAKRFVSFDCCFPRLTRGPISFVSPKEKGERKGDPGVPVDLRLRRKSTSLRCSSCRAAAELARLRRAQTVLAEFPGPPVLLGGPQGREKQTDRSLSAMWLEPNDLGGSRLRSVFRAP
jgi:hypothetical protein